MFLLFNIAIQFIVNEWNIDVQADWSFLINEAALDIVVTTFDTAPLAIMVLGMFTFSFL